MKLAGFSRIKITDPKGIMSANGEYHIPYGEYCDVDDWGYVVPLETNKFQYFVSDPSDSHCPDGLVFYQDSTLLESELIAGDEKTEYMNNLHDNFKSFDHDITPVLITGDHVTNDGWGTVVNDVKNFHPNSSCILADRLAIEYYKGNDVIYEIVDDGGSGTDCPLGAIVWVVKAD